MLKDAVQKMLGQEYKATCREGYRHLRDGRYTEAIESFDQAIRDNPRCTDAYLGKGESLKKLGYHLPALRCYDTVLALDPKRVEAVFQKGVCQVYLGSIVEALLSFDLVLDLNPNDDAAWDNKAICYQLLGEHTKAEQCVSMGMQLRDDFSDYKPLLGRGYGSR